MGNERNARLRALNSLYRLYPQSGSCCVYCGIPADTYDHVPALAVMQMAIDRDQFSCYLVPACRECNSILQADGLTVSERKSIVKRKLKRRYHSALKCAKWTAAELDALGPGLRDAVEQGSSISEWVRRRLAW